MRVLKTAEEGIILDKTGKKNGRGAYLCESMECLKLARKSRGLERSFKMSIPNEVYDNMEKAFSMAKKGDIVLLLGKSHENSIIYKDFVMPYDEISEARKWLLALKS